MHLSGNKTPVEIVYDIARRNTIPYDKSGGKERMVRLCSVLRTVIWRTTIYGNNGLRKIWEVLEANGTDMEWIISMTNEFMLFFNHDEPSNWDELISLIANSVGWVRDSSASIPNKATELSAEPASINMAIKSAPWIVFLYLLSVSDIIYDLQPSVKEPK